jgi:hypothetical protein
MRTIVALAGLALFAGCASIGAKETVTRRSPTTKTIQTADGDIDLEMIAETRTITHWIRANRDTVWASLPEVYQELGVEVRTVDRERGAFGNRDARVTRIAGERLARFVDCGRNPIGAPTANTATVRLEILTMLRESGGGTEVSTRLLARARPRSGSATMTRCTTTGALESLIAQRLGAYTGADTEGR